MILGVKSTQFLITYFVLNNCIYLSLCKMRILWFQECKTSTVLPLLNRSESRLLNIFQFSNLLIGGEKDGPISTQYLPDAVSGAEWRGRTLAMLATCSVTIKRADSFYHTVLMHLNSHLPSGSLLRSCFMASHSPAYAVAWGYASTAAGFYGCSYWNSPDVFWSIPAASWGPFEC